MKFRRNVVFAAVALCSVQVFAANTHTVTFRRLNGTVLMQTNVVHGANATSLAPTVPNESGMNPNGWDHADWLANVTNDVTCWALYEASSAMSPSTGITSKSVADRETPYSLDEYFKMYDNLAWSDEFSGSKLDVGTSSWFGGSSGGNWQNDTEQGSADLAEYTRGNNHSTSNGILRINCRRESATRITSARINSKGKVAFKKGRCEIRAKISKSVGTTPAFWTMGTNAGWPWGGEIDVMEQVNGSEWYQTTLHMPRYAQNTGNNAHESCAGHIGPEDGVHWGDGFHRMGIVVNERELVWYVDDHICQRMDIRDARYDILRNYSQYILLNMNFGGTWAGQTNHNDSTIANFKSEDFEIDYCRIFTNTNENNTFERECDPDGARLSGPVKATIWRGWQMNWGKQGANYYQNHLFTSSSAFIKKALREYCERDNPDIITFFTRPQQDTGKSNVEASFYVPGYTTVNLVPNSGKGWTQWDGDIREKLTSTVLFNKVRFSQEDSAVNTLPISNDYDFTNGCAVVAELVERDTGAKFKVVGAFVSNTNGVTTAGSAAKQGFDALISKLDAMKDEKVILLIQGWDWNCMNYLNSRVSSELGTSFSKLGQFTSFWPVYQSAWVTADFASASAENPAPLSVPKSNGQPSGVHTNQSFCATVQFDADPPIEYGQLDKSSFAKKMDVTFSGYSGAALTDFPVLVKLSTAINGFSYADFKKANGGDLRFADSTGKLLPHEIDTWNQSGVSTVWVKVPSLSANAKITACYGCDEPPEVAAKDVWDENYVGVWHLGEGALPLKESSETSVGFTESKGADIGYGAQGIVGGSVDFGAPQSTRCLMAADHNALDGFETCTFEAWTFVTNRATSGDKSAAILSKRSGYGSAASYHVYDTGSMTTIYVSSNNTSHTFGGSLIAPSVNSWTHQVYSFDKGAIVGYKNGVSAGSANCDVKKINAGDAKLHLGNFQSGDSRSFPGRVDEVRISKVARSAAWIKATHDTIANASFATYAVEGVAPVEPDRILYVNVAAGATNTLNAADVTAYITNIVKQGAGTLRTVAIPDYEGDFRIEGGILDVAVKDGAGKDGFTNTIYVADGGSLCFSGKVNDILNNKKLVFEGVGAATAPLSGKLFNVGGWNTVATGLSMQFKTDTKFVVACWNRMMLRNVDIDMGGHNLTLSCSPGNQVEFSGSTFRNPGNINVGQGMLLYQGSSKNTFVDPPSGAGEIRLRNNAAYLGNGPVSASGWTIIATNSNTNIGGYSNSFPGSSPSGEWNGKIVFGKNSASFCYYNGGSGSTVLSNTVFNVKGRMSGSAPLKVGPGWLNLHTSAADNTCSGAVTVTGKTVPGSSAIDYPILAGGGGIGLWNGAACFPNASSITFTNTARLAFMDSTACSVPQVKFIALAGETQSISGGVYTARSTMAGLTKVGAGTLLVDSPVEVTGLADIKAGTLKLANRINMQGTTQEEVIGPQPIVSNLQFAAGTTFDLSGAFYYGVTELKGAPCVTNGGIFAVTGKWTLTAPGEVLKTRAFNVYFGEYNVAGGFGFVEGATFDLVDEAAFTAAAAAAGDIGILVADTHWIVTNGVAGIDTPLPQPAANISPRWQMFVAGEGRELRLRLAPASGYAAWVAEKGIGGSPNEKYNGIERGVRYAFDIDPASATVGEPIIKVVRDADGNPVVEARELAEGRSDVTFGVLATENLTDWGNATLVPMKKFAADGFWKPTASESSTYVFPAKMFFKYSVEVK